MGRHEVVRSGGRILVRKTRRDLRRRAGQSAAIAVTVMLGVMLFIASYDSFRNLTDSYNQTYDRLHFADLTASGGDPKKLAAIARSAQGVGQVTTRTQADVPLDIDDTKLLGRIVGLGVGESAVNGIELTAGRAPDPATSGEVAIEKHAAETFGLSPGDQFEVYDGTVWRTVVVTGVALSPEYLWPARNRQDILPDPHSFAVVFAPQNQASELAGLPQENQTLVTMASGTTQADRDRVRRVLMSNGAVDV